MRTGEVMGFLGSSASTLQLAAALEWSGPAAGGGFVTFDDRLRTAAEREGFVTP